MSEARDPALGPSLAVLGGSLASILPAWAHLPILLYDPIGRAWRLAPLGGGGASVVAPAPTIEITYYGIYAWALAGALAGALCGRLLERRALSARLPTAWALTSLALAAVYQLWAIWP